MLFLMWRFMDYLLRPFGRVLVVAWDCDTKRISNIYVGKSTDFLRGEIIA